MFKIYDINFQKKANKKELFKNLWQMYSYIFEFLGNLWIFLNVTQKVAYTVPAQVTHSGSKW